MLRSLANVVVQLQKYRVAQKSPHHQAWLQRGLCTASRRKFPPLNKILCTQCWNLTKRLTYSSHHEFSLNKQTNTQLHWIKYENRSEEKIVTKHRVPPFCLRTQRVCDRGAISCRARRLCHTNQSPEKIVKQQSCNEFTQKTLELFWFNLIGIVLSHKLLCSPVFVCCWLLVMGTHVAGLKVLLIKLIYHFVC